MQLTGETIEVDLLASSSGVQLHLNIDLSIKEKGGQSRTENPCTTEIDLFKKARSIPPQIETLTIESRSVVQEIDLRRLKKKSGQKREYQPELAKIWSAKTELRELPSNKWRRRHRAHRNLTKPIDEKASDSDRRRCVRSFVSSMASTMVNSSGVDRKSVTTSGLNDSSNWARLDTKLRTDFGPEFGGLFCDWILTNLGNGGLHLHLIKKEKKSQI